jgi:hypothetical protein
VRARTARRGAASAYQNNHAIEPTRLNGHEKRGSFAEYFYDALGRRIQVRTRRDGLCYASTTNASTVDCSGGIERFVWSGDNILWEMRGPGGNTATPEQLNQVSGTGDPYGVVGYTYAGGVDRPLVAWKGTSTVVVPHLNWRGLFGKGTDANGNASAAEIEWPGFQTTASHSRAPTQLSAGRCRLLSHHRFGHDDSRSRDFSPADASAGALRPQPHLEADGVPKGPGSRRSQGSLHESRKPVGQQQLHG